MIADAENPEETLADVCADLLAETRHEPFMVRLFSGRPGHWQPLSTLVHELDVAGQVEALDRALSTATRVAWLDYPDCQEGDGYATVMFFNEAGLGRVWIYNRSRLLRASAHVTG
jgi:hypothetical protein